MKLETVAISNGKGGGEYDTYTVYLAQNNNCGNAFTIYNGDLLYHIDAKLCLRSNKDSSILIKSVAEIFLAPQANFFPIPGVTKAVAGGKEYPYGNGRGIIQEQLIENNRLIKQAESENPITTILMEGLNSSNPLNSIEQLSNIKSIIDYVFSKPHLLLSVLLILRNEGGAQHYFADAGNVPHTNQLILNMHHTRTNFADKLHSGTQFGIASYPHYGRRVYKSVFDLDIADYIIISISYYPTVSQGDIGYQDIVRYYDSKLNDYRYSFYSFHLWRHSLYGGFAGVVIGSGYSTNGYALRPECACKAMKLQIDAQSQQVFKKGWYAVLHFPTAFYILLLYLAMELPDKQHNNKTVREALDKLNNIENNSPFYQKVIKRFADEIGEEVLREILKAGIDHIKSMTNNFQYKNPLQMLWNYCKEIIVAKTHNKIINRYQEYAPNSNKIPKLKERLRIVTEYIDNEFKSINNRLDNLYNQILREEKKFFDN